MRIVEAYVGEYASGKSENAVNRALQLAAAGKKVTLVDLDLVEPCYTLRPIKRMLEDKGIDVVAWETAETIGLGEAGSTMKPAMRWVLRRPGDVILDIGYGVHGARILNLIEGAKNDPDLRVYAVVNLGRSMTSNQEEVREYLRELGKIDGVINNSHLGEETTPEFIQEGARIIKAVTAELGVPMIATAVEESLASKIGEKDIVGSPVWALHRYMPDTFW